MLTVCLLSCHGTRRCGVKPPPPHLDLHLDAHCRRRLAALQSPPLALASPACSDVEDAEPLLADLHQMNRSEYY